MLNLIYAMKIFGHRSIESFRRELSRNSQLRIACVLSEGKYKYCRDRKHLIPPARVFTGFLKKLKKCKEEIEEIFEELVKFMYENLEGFGEDCAYVSGKRPAVGKSYNWWEKTARKFCPVRQSYLGTKSKRETFLVVVSLTLPIHIRFWHMMKKPMVSGLLAVIATALATSIRLLGLDFTTIKSVVAAAALVGLCFIDVLLPTEKEIKKVEFSKLGTPLNFATNLRNLFDII